jgi:triacylglycerol lipase
MVSLATLPALVACGSAAGDPSPTGGGPVAADSSSGAPAAAESAPPDTPAPAKLGAPYPIVFLHGMGGFTQLQNLPIDVVYFNGVHDDLAKQGEVEVFATIAPAYDTSLERAKAIAPQIDAILARTGRAKVNLIGHSQGGMDARVLASPAGLGYGDRIASITTVATPHRGTKVADLTMGILENVPAGIVDSVTTDFLSVLQKTVYEVNHDARLRAQLIEMSEDHMTKVFNPTFVDDPRVAYGSYGGRTNLQTGVVACGNTRFSDDPTKLDAAQPFLQPTAAFLEEGIRKANDGLVTVDSARWGTFQQCIPADHLKEVGLLDPSPDLLSKFDHLAFFRTAVARIRKDGF